MVSLHCLRRDRGRGGECELTAKSTPPDRMQLRSSNYVLTLCPTRFLWLGNHFNYASRPLSILTKVCVQQAVFTPVFNTYFFGMQAILTGESPSGVLERIKGAVPTSMWNSLKLWPAVTAFSFAFIRAEYRFMFSGLFAVCWQAYLSFLNRSEERRERVGMSVARGLGVLNVRKVDGEGREA